MQGLWFKKIGMTQIFQGDGSLIPVTVLETGRWVITQVKKVDTDGYEAIQVGCMREAHQQKEFDASWLADKDTYFSRLCEIPSSEHNENNVVGATIDAGSLYQERDKVTVVGCTIGRGFQGGVKRHDFAGGPGSHGGKLGRKPGSMGFMRSRGRVIKGWRMAGHMGVEQRTVQNILVVRVEVNDANKQCFLFVKGSLPGKSKSYLYVQKR